MTEAFDLARAAGFPTTATYLRHLAARALTAERELASALRELDRLNTHNDAAHDHTQGEAMTDPTAFAEDDPRHGTYAGWNVESQLGLEVCDACRVARNAYMRNYRRKALAGMFTFPLSAPPDIDSLGATIARSFRESA